MNNAESDRITIAVKRTKAESLELTARRLRQEADEIERQLIKRSGIMPTTRKLVAQYG